MEKYKFPGGAQEILADKQGYFFKKDAPVLKRLINCRDKQFIDVLFKIDSKIKKYYPINSYMGQWRIFLDIFVSCATDFKAQRAVSKKDVKVIFEKKLSKITELAKSLADEMNDLAVYGEKNGLSEDASVHPLDLINKAVENQTDPETAFRYNSPWYEGKSVRNLVNSAKRFDLKYFPSIPEVIDEVARQYSKDYIVFDSAKVPKQVGKINTFCEHFFSSINHHIEMNHLPEDILEITQPELANLLRVGLANDGIDVQDIKNYKQSQKNK